MRGEVPAWDGAPVPLGAAGPVFSGSVAPGVAVSAASLLVWNEDLDTHGVFGGGTGLITIPAGWGGLYQVSLSWKPSTAISVAFFVKKNGANYRVTPGSPPTAFTGMASALIVPLAAGDTLSFQASGSFTTTSDVAANTWCDVAWLRP